MFNVRKWQQAQWLLLIGFLLLTAPRPAVAGAYYLSGNGGYYTSGRAYCAVPAVGGMPLNYAVPPLPYRGHGSLGGNSCLPEATDYLSSVCAQGAYTWQASSMPVKIFIADGKGAPGYKPIFQDYVRRGFDAWCQASGNKLSWAEVDDPKQANVTVRFTDRVTERPEGTEAGRTSVMTKLNTATGKGIIYGARMQFLTRLPGRFFADQEVEKTCLHEAGHALGLQGHSPYSNDIMYFAVGPSQKPQLTDRDRNTLVKLYADAPTLTELTLGNQRSAQAGLPAQR